MSTTPSPPPHVALIPNAPPDSLHGIAWGSVRKGLMAKVERYVKVNRKKLGKPHVQYLLKLYEGRHFDGGTGWMKLSRKRIVAKKVKEPVVVDGTVQTGDYKMLVRWGLAEMHPKSRGTLRITPYGIAFVDGYVKVPEAAFFENYRNRMVCFDGQPRSFAEVAATEFDLSKL